MIHFTAVTFGTILAGWIAIAIGMGVGVGRAARIADQHADTPPPPEWDLSDLPVDVLTDIEVEDRFYALVDSTAWFVGGDAA